MSIKSLIYLVGIMSFLLFGYYLINKESKNTSAEDNRRMEYLSKKMAKKKAGINKLAMPELYAQMQRDLRTPYDLNAPSYTSNYLMNELSKVKRSENKNNDIVFTERGPGNVGGRTRAIVVYQDDFTNDTWLAGSASGGIWKTTDGGQNWVHKTQNLPNFGTNTLAQSLSNKDIVYAGTGEHFTNDLDGSGMFKSMDFGETWEQIADPEEFPDFRNVSRIIVDPSNPDIVVASTRNSVWDRSGDEDGPLVGDLRSAIYKTTDGGVSWKRTFSSDEMRIDDLEYDVNDFNNLYAAVLGTGVLKSTDGGETWVNKSDGLNPNGRIEIAISEVNPDRIWAAALGPETGTGSDLYVSSDGAESWNLVSAPEGSTNVHFLTGQGWYDNTVAAHPFEEDIVYVGGVNLWKFELTGDSIDATRFVVQELGTQPFLDLVNFGGAVGNGGIDLGEDLTQNEILPIELRFGQGGQKAHRFTVDGRGSGVPASDYTYEDLVDIPFQAWDTENNRQLMVSFRDQQNDSIWNLIPQFTGEPTEANSREYIYVHDVTYTDTTDANIAVSGGGHEYRNMYFMWPVLTDSTYIDNNFPESNFRINKEKTEALEKNISNISDAYFEYDQINTYSNANLRNFVGVHPDQHNITILKDDPNRKFFRLLIGNDGGLYVSRRSRDPGVLDGAFSFASFGYNTTQFYGADKAPGEDRYIGGTQDNSTWFTPASQSADASTYYTFAIGGDGFESIWNNRDKNLMLGASQFNGISRSTNQGVIWTNATQGIDDNGPFISRLANSKKFPDRVFTVGSSGVWVSNNFGANWEPTRIESDFWSFNNSIDIEVSVADYDVVWTGGDMSEDGRIFVSTDGGASFSESALYPDVKLGFVSGLATHPEDKNTAYSLFSFQGRPKVLMTNDLGETWEDISGFADSQNGVSTRGFPDVAVNTLFVFPNDTDRIWVGSEIGIIETLDGGATWALMDNSMGAANTYDFILQDDQLVIATYGRGIWTATIQGLDTRIIFPPVIVNSFVAPDGNIKLEVDYPEQFDSSIVLLNGVEVASEGINEIGIENILLDNPNIEGEAQIQVLAYLDSVEYSSVKFNLQLFIPVEPVIEYFNDFSDESTYSDFSGNGFEIYTESGFDDEAIHSLHPYTNAENFIYTLTKPIRIKGQQFLSYNDVAIIESGEPGSVYGDNDFWDYVIVEGSRDGENWIELLDGYDARSDGGWLDAYNQGASGRQNLYVYHEIDLSQFFDKDDIVLLRFRLFADAAAIGWGWAIDNVSVVLDNTTPTVDIAITENKVYPNPTNGNLNIEVDPKFDFDNIIVRNYLGQIIRRVKLESALKYTIDLSSEQSGVYFVEFLGQEDRTVQKIIKE